MRFVSAFIAIVLATFQVNALVIDRVIMSSDDNPMYLDFWPVVAKAWSKFGIRPTLALIARSDVQVDESLGDVVRFEPVQGLSNALYAQAVRLLVPVLFEHEVSLISDIDMIPLSESYFKSSVCSIADDKFVVYRDNAYPQNLHKYPMCYNVAKGLTFQELFGIKSRDEIPRMIMQWAQLNWGWNTDELVLYMYLHKWAYFDTRCVSLHHGVSRRIDRSNWHYNSSLLANNYYIDCHSVRPYKKYKSEVDTLMQLIGI